MLPDQILVLCRSPHILFASVLVFSLIFLVLVKEPQGWKLTGVLAVSDQTAVVVLR